MDTKSTQQSNWTEGGDKMLKIIDGTKHRPQVRKTGEFVTVFAS